MAQRRMLNKSISQSLQVDRLPLPGQLLFTWMISHADDDGRLNGEPKWVKATVVPLKNKGKWSIRYIQEYLLKMADVSLIYYWYQNGTRYIEFPTWQEHQTIQADRATLSRIPAYNPAKAVDAKAFPEIPEDAKMDTERIHSLIGTSTQYFLSESNIKDFIDREKKVSDLLSYSGMKVPKISTTDPRVSSIFKFYSATVKEKKDFVPDINWAKEGFLVKHRLKKYTEDQLKDLITQYLDSQDCENIGPSLGVIMSSGIINKWLAKSLHKKRPSVTKI